MPERTPELPQEYAHKSLDWIEGYFQGQIDAHKKFRAYLDSLIVKAEKAGEPK